MAYPVDLETLMLKARQRANLETGDAAADDFITDDELASEVNTSLAEWWDFIRATTFSGTLCRKRFPFQTTAAIQDTPPVSPPRGSYYPLPADFLHLISVDISVGQNLVLTAESLPEEKRNAFKFYPVGAWTQYDPIYYRLDAGNIVFFPPPPGQYNIQLNYCPTAPRLSRPDDSFDSINSWEEWIVLDVAIKMLIKDGQTDLIPMLVQMRDKQEARIKSLVPKRDMQTAEMIHETHFADEWLW